MYSIVKSKEYPHEVADSLFLHYSYIDTMYNLIYTSELGEKDVYNYSDLGYYMFKKIIENTYKDTLNNLLDIYFYKKLGMNYLGYSPKRKFKLNDIVPTEHDWNLEVKQFTDMFMIWELQCKEEWGDMQVYFQMPMI